MQGDSGRKARKHPKAFHSGLVAVFVKDCFSGSCGKTWSNWHPWSISAGAAFFAIAKVPYM